MKANPILDGLFGLCVGDALGVPVEFEDREYLDKKPVTDMMGFGTHGQPPGTWSDDSSLAFCLADSLCSGFDIEDIAASFVKWYREGLWAPHGEVFDIGNTTRKAIRRIESGASPTEAGGKGEYDNGNGSLMRILPMVHYVQDMDLDDRVPFVEDVSAITHAHLRSKIACVIYIEMVLGILSGEDIKGSYDKMKRTVADYYSETGELIHFKRILKEDISELERDKIKTRGYVVYTLEASLWSLLTTNSYSEAVLKAVNLGFDTDTTGAVTGGLAGLHYGFQNIPESWKGEIEKKNEIVTLSRRLFDSIHKKNSIVL